MSTEKKPWLTSEFWLGVALMLVASSLAYWAGHFSVWLAQRVPATLK